MAKLNGEFQKRGVKVIGLSVDVIDDTLTVRSRPDSLALGARGRVVG